MSSQPHAQRQRLTAQTLERMRDGIRKRSEAIGRDHERRFADVGRMVARNRRAGMSQQELAILCGTTQSAIARLSVAAGRQRHLDAIADALDASCCRGGLR
jgi:ribosome-binding protein aMBF1 (putative translation factor)